MTKSQKIQADVIEIPQIHWQIIEKPHTQIDFLSRLVNIAQDFLQITQFDQMLLSSTLRFQTS